jgi:hypothetical protein
MVVLIHVLTALGSLAATTLAYLLPSNTKVRLSKALFAATLASGTYLVLATHAKMLESCLMGLAYMAVSLIGIIAARTKLITERTN